VRGDGGDELNAATDNPMVFADTASCSRRNFHGAPVAMAADLLAIATAELGSISERRVERLVNPRSPACPPSWPGTAACTPG
jgi:histidine ammonia-lyase